MGNRIRIDPTTRTPLAADGSLASVDEATKELLRLREAIESRPSKYVELTARTNFSFLAGATSPEQMVFRAAELGYDAIAITDRDGLYGIVRAQEEGERQKVRVIVGCELTLEQEGLDVPDVPGKPTTLTVLVENHVGYTNLCKILTESHERHPKSQPIKRTDNLDDDELPRNTFAGIPLSFVCAHAEGLWALADATLPLAELHRCFGLRLSIAVHLHKDGEDRARVTRALDAARIHGVPLCATNRVLFAKPEEKPIYDLLHCIREGKTLDEAGRELLPNAEGASQERRGAPAPLLAASRLDRAHARRRRSLPLLDQGALVPVPLRNNGSRPSRLREPRRERSPHRDLRPGAPPPHAWAARRIATPARCPRR